MSRQKGKIEENLIFELIEILYTVCCTR